MTVGREAIVLLCGLALTVLFVDGAVIGKKMKELETSSPNVDYTWGESSPNSATPAMKTRH